MQRNYFGLVVFLKPTATTSRFLQWRISRVGWALLGAALAQTAGCSPEKTNEIIYYCDGAGWYSGAAPVKSGLRDAGYTGEFEVFSWSSFLGPAHDHIVVARSQLVARRLTRKIEDMRRNNPACPIHLVGLSAGSSVVLSAIEQLDPGVQVDNVALLSSSVSAKRDLTKLMRHVRGYLYATTSPHDGILPGRGITADGKIDRFAGEVGFRLPTRVSRATRDAYRRVVNLPWQPAYLAFGWDGGHTAVTKSSFIAAVIAPRIMLGGPHPLDRSVFDLALARAGTK